ncbi:unnamed protein product [Spirodela intermedia]|uniref:Uncharacterized protein n=1 Tax=Spirodela intermedia TaxID=51605 RepID=A0A7I8JAA7_SPIIN|nr:unnamed protein product [Spirodela intermedia]CAA6666931.1 unnamed protein product [Spirodela intermedia]
MGSRSKEAEGDAGAAEGGAVEPPGRRFRYNSPLAQVVLIGLVCFCCPGMFNALSGMGGGGQVDHDAANDANTALYTTFAVFGVLGGGVYNLFGPRLTLFAGCSTYVLYAGSFLYYNHRHDQNFAVVAGAVLGGAIMTSYPPPSRKGSYIAVFWSIFNMGGVIGGLIPFVLNYRRTAAASVNDGTYITFMCFIRVVRDDGSRASAVRYSNVSTEAVEITKLFTDWRMLLIAPAAWASNFFYTYQFNNVNGLLFNLRTSGLNNVFYWGAQMVGSAGIGWVLDYGCHSRRHRGFLGIAAVAALGTASWGGGLANQLRYPDGKWEQKLDFKDSGEAYAGPFLLYFSYGLLDAAFQSLVYWLIGVQSAGAAVAWQVDKRRTPLLAQLAVNWALTTVSFPLMALLVALAVEDEAAPPDSGDSESAAPPVAHRSESPPPKPAPCSAD